MKFDPGIHIIMHSILSLKLGVTKVPFGVSRDQYTGPLEASGLFNIQNDAFTQSMCQKAKVVTRGVLAFAVGRVV